MVRPIFELEARLKRECRLDRLKTGQFFFQLRIQNHGPAWSVPPQVHDAELLDRSCPLPLAEGDCNEIIVRTEVQHFLPSTVIQAP